MQDRDIDDTRIDPEIVMGILQRGIDDIKAFSSEIISFIDGQTV